MQLMQLSFSLKTMHNSIANDLKKVLRSLYHFTPVYKFLGLYPIKN